MRTTFRILLVAAAALAQAASVPIARADEPDKDESRPRVRNRVLARALDIEAGRAVRLKYEQPVSGGVMTAAKEAMEEVERRDAAGADASSLRGAQDNEHGGPPADAPSRRRTQGCSNVFVGHGVRNIRVNQDCSLRRQAEEAIAINPTGDHNLIVGYNDSRIGFNSGGYAWSFDRGRSWGDQVPPFFGFLMADGASADAFSDPTATFDADGNAYIGGVLFDINYPASAAVVAKSNAGIGGAFYHTPAPGPFQLNSVTPLGVIASDNDPNIAHDKEFIVADASASSIKKNNVYMTWTRFDFDTGAGVGGHSPIYFSQSTNGGRTWSTGVEINGSSATVCGVFSGEADPNACDQDQGSHPVVGTDGTLYVSFNNGNTPLLGINQQLFVKCPAALDCTLATNWTAPVKIADDIGTQPIAIAPNAAGCPVGRQCLPPNGYRMNDFGALSVDNSGKLYFVWSDFRFGGTATCTPLGPATGSQCNNDVFYAHSTNGGATWSPAINVTPASKFSTTAQWQAWGAVAPDGDNLWIGYYDRHYGSCETTGCNDITLAKVRRPATGSPRMSYQRVTTSSMPNLVPANNPLQAGFLGDYMWVAADAKGRPHVVWADTRGLNGSVEEDVYYAKFGDDDDDDGDDDDRHDHR